MTGFIENNLVAILALLVSAWVLYRDYLRRFILQARVAGRVTLGRNPFAPTIKQDCIIADLIFVNHGAQRGIVEDVAIIVRHDGGPSVFRSLGVVEDRRLHLGRDLTPPHMSTFIAFEIPKDEALVRRLCFVFTDRTTEWTFRQDVYHCELVVVTSSSKKWKTAGHFTFTVDQSDVAAINSTTATPKSDGGLYLHWITRDKPLDEVEQRTETLLASVRK